MKGGYRAGAGRPRGVKEKNPRKLSEAREEADQIRQLLAVGKKAKQKLLHEFLFRVANKDGKQKPLSVVEKKMMDQWAVELAAELEGDRPQGELGTLDPLTYMLNVMNDPHEPKDRRDRMAISAAPFVHPRKGEAGTGKKDEQADRAKVAGQGRFAPSKQPLALVK